MGTGKLFAFNFQDGNGLIIKKMKTEKMKTQNVFKAYYVSIIGFDSFSQRNNEDGNSKLLRPYFLESVGEDEVCEKVFQQEQCYVQLEGEPESNTEKLIFYDFEGNFNLEFTLVKRFDEMPELTIGMSLSTENAIILLQYDREFHVLVTNLKVERSAQLVADLVLGKLLNELASFLELDHDLEDELFTHE